MTGELIKYARAKDDENFVWRIAAAMTLQAQYNSQQAGEYSAASTRLTDWVLSNPMEPLDVMIAFVSTNATVAANVTVGVDGAVDTSAVPDDDIKYVVGASWEAVAARKYASL